MTARPRPLSPHLSIYKPQISSVLSITHRMTGVALALGSLLLLAWLWGAAYAPVLGDHIHDIAGAWYGQLLLAGWTFAYFYHLANGIRHLFWDAGKGFALEDMHKSGVAVLAAAFALTGLVWYIILFM